MKFDLSWFWALWWKRGLKVVFRRDIKASGYKEILPWARDKICPNCTPPVPPLNLSSREHSTTWSKILHFHPPPRLRSCEGIQQLVLGTSIAKLFSPDGTPSHPCGQVEMRPGATRQGRVSTMRGARYPREPSLWGLPEFLRILGGCFSSYSVESQWIYGVW